MVERRKESRTDVRFPVYIVCLNDDGSPSSEDAATALNISASGLLIETRFPVLTQRIKIMARHRDGEDVEVFAEVVYAINLDKERCRCGLSFVGDADQIARFVSSLPPAEG
jgi:hypothetical protein